MEMESEKTCYSDDARTSDNPLISGSFFFNEPIHILWLSGSKILEMIAVYNKKTVLWKPAYYLTHLRHDCLIN